MARLNAITFDLWQTLILDSPELGRPRARVRLGGVQEALRGDGLDFPFDKLMEASRSCYRVCDDIRTAEGDVTFEEQIDIFLREVEPGLASRITPATLALVSQRYADSYFAHPPKIDEGAHRVLETLSRMGVKVGLICNTGSTPGATQRIFLDQVGLARYFDTLVFSDEERLSKPAKRLFHLTLERLGVQPEETVHIGDHPLNDVVGAKRAGMRAIWLRRPGKEEPSVPPDALIDDLADTVAAFQRLTS